MAVIVIVNLLHIKDCEEWREEVYVCDELNILANAGSPPHFCLKVVCEKVGGCICVMHARGALNGSVLLLVTAYLP